MINNNPLVSVIIPNYNHARYLDQRIQTVLNQTYQNFEVIILDDKSTDNSLDVIAKYKDNTHISQIVVNKQNSGSPFKQWDKGIRLAQGDLIWIAESDDYCELNMLEDLVKEFQKNENIVLAFCSCVKVDEQNSIIGKIKERRNRCFQGHKFIKKRLARYCAVNSASCAVFSKETATHISSLYLSFTNTGDYQFWSEISSQGNVSLVRKNLVYWRQSVRSVTGNNLSKGITALEDKRVFDWILEKYKLSHIEKWLAEVNHHEAYAKAYFENEDIRENVLLNWKTNKIKNIIGKILLWLSPRFENYFGILL